MSLPIRFLALAACALIAISCTEEKIVNVSGAKEMVANQRYYPLLEGTYWQYRYDSVNAQGTWTRDFSRRTTRLYGTRKFDSLVYTIQVNETLSGVTNTFDTNYVRKTNEGVFITSPLLLGLGGLPQIPGLPDLGLLIPREVKILPYPPTLGTSWSMFSFEFSPIPIYTIYLRMNGTLQGIETVVTERRTYENCLRIRVLLDGRFPNPEDPTDIFNPLVIYENASFWFSPSHGWVQGDGSEMIFQMLDGRIPNILDLPKRRIHVEAMGMSIVQPNDTCTYRGNVY